MVSVNVRDFWDCHHMSLGFFGQLKTGGQLGTTVVVPSDARGNSCSGQLRQPQVPESIAKGKNLLAIIPIIFVRQHFCYFYYTCMSSRSIEHEH